MKTTGNRHAGADGQDYALRPHTASSERGSRISAGSGIRPAVAAMGAAALLAVLGTLPLGAQAVTCNPGQRGTLSAGNVFVAGSTGNDYRVVCTGTGSSTEAVTPDDIDAALHHADADPRGDYVNRFIVQFSNAYFDWGTEYEEGGNVVFLGSAQGASGKHGINLRVWNELEFWNDLNIDSHATVQTTGGGRGIDVGVRDDHHTGTVRVRNHGSITTSGGGTSDGDRRGRGIDVTSNGGDAEAINESGGSVVTRGPGARAVGAGSVDGTATAINRGTITTQGNGFFRRGSPQTSVGLNIRGPMAMASWHGRPTKRVGLSGPAVPGRKASMRELPSARAPPLRPIEGRSRPQGAYCRAAPATGRLTV